MDKLIPLLTATNTVIDLSGNDNVTVQGYQNNGGYSNQKWVALTAGNGWTFKNETSPLFDHLPPVLLRVPIPLAWTLDEDKDDHNDNDEGLILSDDSLSGESCLGSSSDSDTDTSSSLLTSSTPDHCTCSLHALHWPSKVNKQCHHLCTLVISYLHTLFELNPSPNLYISIIELSDEPELTSIELLDTLSDIATSNSSTFALALAIYVSEGDMREIVQLLNTHVHLLRPQDTLSYQAAVVTMAEEEVLDKGGDGIPPPLHPIAFVAMMMGFPVYVPLNSGDINKNDLDTDEGGPFSFRGMGMGGMGGMGLLDMDPDNPDLDDVREELRPRLKERFEGWVEAAMKIKGGLGVLARVYTRMVSEKEDSEKL
ncbi:hypothetical protein GYMLUDRAFT_253148 [Collybiopsis luxurians FD-317 M1]|uniref:Uncharacterized protein n=1 Tax=Collybiopsis luxurians FD-317 M1 TaxID=944289 RepID=A0A0D0B7Z2_9AGAR|nr:hypothetical protein GYMLUDRAFT_253148 [Collybiopsis luxurians FD-317 M1]